MSTGLLDNNPVNDPPAMLIDRAHMAYGACVAVRIDTVNARQTDRWSY